MSLLFEVYIMILMMIYVVSNLIYMEIAREHANRMNSAYKRANETNSAQLYTNDRSWNTITDLIAHECKRQAYNAVKENRNE